jgi:hypothetical protein
VEVFEAIRRDYRREELSIRQLADRHRVHREGWRGGRGRPVPPQAPQYSSPLKREAVALELSRQRDADTGPAVIRKRFGHRELAPRQLGDQFRVVHEGHGLTRSSQVAGIERAIFDLVSAVNSWKISLSRCSTIATWNSRSTPSQWPCR